MFVLPKYTWDKDRETCKQCKHYIPSKDANCRDTGAVVMLCSVNPYKARRGIGTCIDNRTRGPCGKEGKQFESVLIPSKGVRSSGKTMPKGDEPPHSIT